MVKRSSFGLFVLAGGIALGGGAGCDDKESPLPYVKQPAAGGSGGASGSGAQGGGPGQGGSSGAGAQGGSSGKGGSSGSGAQGGSSGSGGQAGSSGTGGQAGSSGTGGSSGAGGQAGSSGQGGQATSVQIPMLSAKTKALYDDNGIFHVRCAKDEDCFATLGYVHAANRFFFMDFVRNLVRGSLGSLVKAGSVVVDQDVKNRLFFSTPQGKPLEQELYDNADADAKAQLDAYSRGVNAWINDMRAGKNGATLTTEYDFALIVKDAIRDWEPQDSTAVGLYVLQDLSDNSGDEIYLSNVVAGLGPDLGFDVLSPRPVFDEFTIPAATGMPPSLPGSPAQPAGGGIDGDAFARVLSARPLLAPLAQQLTGSPGPLTRKPKDGTGSNNWVLSPKRTAAGQGLLCNDPHLGLGNPAIWFPAEIDAKSEGSGSYHMVGGTFPGLPNVFTGHNEKIAWGVTVVYYDLSDVYVEQLSDDGKSVLFNGQMVPIVEKTVDFADASTGMPVTKTLRWVPHHGPIIAEDMAKKTATTVRWVAHGGSTDLQAFMKLGKAGSVSEAREALKDVTSADQNFVVMDVDGNIGWFPFGKVPQRPWASAKLPPWLPLPGDGSAEWQGFVPVDQLPQLDNPEKGFVATANQDATGQSLDGDMTNDGQPAIQAWSKDPGVREKRIVDLLEQGGNAHTRATMHAIQGDTYSLVGETLAPLFAEGTTGNLSDAGKQVAAAIANWKFTCPSGLEGGDPKGPKSSDMKLATESVGCAAFHVALYQLAGLAIDDELKAKMVSVGSSDKVDFLMRSVLKPDTLKLGQAFWDDVTTADKTETRADIARAALEGAAKALAPLGGPDEWRWGRIHTVTLRSIYDNFGVPTYNEGPFAAPGGLYTVNVANPSGPSGTDMHFNNGPSLRTVIEAGPKGPRLEFQYPGGADLHRKSPYYDNLVAKWLKNEPVAVPFGADELPSPAVSIEVSPAP